MNEETYTGPIQDDHINWTVTPRFDFATEVDALQTLVDLGERLALARREVDELMRYLRAAVPAARVNGEGITAAQAIIDHSGLSRRTVYGILAETGLETGESPE